MWFMCIDGSQGAALRKELTRTVTNFVHTVVMDCWTQTMPIWWPVYRVSVTLLRVRPVRIM